MKRMFRVERTFEAGGSSSTGHDRPKAIYPYLLADEESAFPSGLGRGPAEYKFWKQPYGQAKSLVWLSDRTRTGLNEYGRWGLEPLRPT